MRTHWETGKNGKKILPPPPNLKRIKARHLGPFHWPKFYCASGFDGPGGTLPCWPPSQPVSPSPVPSTHTTCRDSPVPSPPLLATVTPLQPVIHYVRAQHGPETRAPSGTDGRSEFIYKMGCTLKLSK